MTDWAQPFSSSYRYARVSRKTGLEVGRVDGIRPGGTIERNLDTAIKESGGASCTGALDLGADLLRVWLDARFDDGSTDSVPLGTFLCSVDSRATDGAASDTSLRLSGRLQELEAQTFGEPFTVAAGSDLVSVAAGIVRGAGLECVAEPSAHRSSSPLYYGIVPTGSEASADGSMLSVVNDLLGRAGFSSAWTDGMGAVHLTRYAEVAERPVSFVFEEGGNATFLPQVSDTVDTSGAVNTVYAVYSWDGGSVVGKAVDDDPASRWSVGNVGRVIARREDYDGEATKQQADAKARELLMSSGACLRKVVFKHVYAPVRCGDAVRVAYHTGGVQGKMGIRTMRLSLGDGCLTETEATTYVR